MPVERDIVYAARERELHLDIYTPDGGDAETRTAVVLVFGGGWRRGKQADVETNAQQLASLGFVALVPDFRQLGEAPWPAQADDIKAAVIWTRDNAERLGVEPDRIAIEGYSSGGHLALMAAAGAPDVPVAAVIAFYPPVELGVGDTAPDVRKADMLLGEAATAQTARAASPIAQVGPHFPPTFLLHGSKDWQTPPSASLRLYQALISAGVTAELHLVAGHTHDFAKLPSMVGPMQAEVALFLRRMVVDPKGYDAENQKLNIFAGGPEAMARLRQQAQTGGDR